MDEFRTIDEIKAHCDQVFIDAPPLKVESDIVAPPSGTPRTYRLVVYLMAPAMPEIISPLRTRLEQIKNHALTSGRFNVRTQYGRVEPVGYHFELYASTLNP